MQGQVGRHEFPFTPKTIAMVAAWQAAVHSPAKPSPCISHATTAQGEFPPLWGWQGELAGSRAGVGTGHAALLQGRHSSAFTRLSLLGSWPASLYPAARPAPRLTSYSWENFSPSLALRRLMLSARSSTGMGGWSRMPASETRRREGEENGLRLCVAQEGSARACAQQTQEVGGCKADTCDDVKRRAGWMEADGLTRHAAHSPGARGDGTQR